LRRHTTCRTHYDLPTASLHTLRRVGRAGLALIYVGGEICSGMLTSKRFASTTALREKTG
jgi:hypothetical protein